MKNQRKEGHEKNNMLQSVVASLTLPLDSKAYDKSKNQQRVDTLGTVHPASATKLSVWRYKRIKTELIFGPKTFILNIWTKCSITW